MSTAASAAVAQRPIPIKTEAKKTIARIGSSMARSVPVLPRLSQNVAE